MLFYFPFLNDKKHIAKKKRNDQSSGFQVAFINSHREGKTERKKKKTPTGLQNNNKE